MTAKTPPVHPAVFSEQLVVPLAEALARYVVPGGTVLDPFAGLGHRLARICGIAGMTPVGMEIEQGYFDLGQTHECVIQGDSTEIFWPLNTFDGAITSPVYPNGMADSFVAQDASVRHTYVHRLRRHLGDGYMLHANNAGGFNPRRSPKALAAFYDINCRVWREVYRVLKPGAPFIVNVKDPLKVNFMHDTWQQLHGAGFRLVEHIEVATPGLNHGRNREKKLSYEDIIVAVKEAGPSMACPR